MRLTTGCSGRRSAAAEPARSPTRLWIVVYGRDARDRLTDGSSRVDGTA
jgi:hypothetical protein